MMSDLKLYRVPIDQYERLNFPLFTGAFGRLGVLCNNIRGRLGVLALMG